MKKLLLLGIAVSVAAGLYSAQAIAQPSNPDPAQFAPSTAPITAGGQTTTVTGGTFSGTVGNDTATIPRTAEPGAIQELPPVMMAPPVSAVPPALPAPPVAPEPPASTPVAAPAAAPETPAAADPCAAYLNTPDVYTFCQDRLKKIERMKGAKTKRGDNDKAYYEKINERRNPPPAKPKEPTNKIVAPPASPVDSSGQPTEKKAEKDDKESTDNPSTSGTASPAPAAP